MTLKDGFHDVPAGKIAMVVTHLEMLTPHNRGAVLPAGLEFTEFPRDPDAYRDLFRRIGQDWLWFGRLTLSDAELREILEDPGVQLYTLQKNGVAEALLELDFRVPGACELAYFGLTQTLIGTGAGAYLMDQAVKLAFGKDITRFHVHTCTIDSPQALGFYIRSGFAPTRRQIEIADDPRTIGIYPADTAAHTPLL